MVFFFEVTVFGLKSMFWRAAQDPSKIRAGARGLCSRPEHRLQKKNGDFNEKTIDFKTKYPARASPSRVRTANVQEQPERDLPSSLAIRI